MKPYELATNANMWDFIDAEFSSIITPVHQRLSSDELKPAEAATIFSSLLKLAYTGYRLSLNVAGSDRSILLQLKLVTHWWKNLIELWR